MDKNELKNLFARHTPTAEQQEIMDGVRKEALKLAGTMLVNSPGSAEQTIALRKVQEALMYFNLAVLLPHQPVDVVRVFPAPATTLREQLIAEDSE